MNLPPNYDKSGQDRVDMLATDVQRRLYPLKVDEGNRGGTHW